MSTPETLSRVMSEEKRVVAMRLEWPEITEEIFEDDSNAGTFLLGKGWIPLILIVHEYSAKVYGFS